MHWKVYLSGEIHTDWRAQIEQAVSKLELPISFHSAVTEHEANDAAGDHLAPTSYGFWRDHQSAKVNAIRNKSLIKKCDVAVIRFGEKYKQWNATFDAGMCAALGKPCITLHDEALVHPLKEVNAAALAWAQSPQQVVHTLQYVVAA